MRQVISTERRPIKLWLDDMEEGALAQAKNLANLPFIHKWVAIMPDSHQGYGMPIGGVLATEGVIIPNAVGVDIGCLDGETEFLSRSGWIRLSRYCGEEVLQYDKETDESIFVTPLNYIKKPTKGFYSLKHKYGLDMVVSKDHKMLIWKGYKSRGYKNTQDYVAENFVNKHLSLKKGIAGAIKTTFNLKQNTKVSFSDDEIKLITMISADGRVHERKVKLPFVEMHFKKERKIKRAVKLLENLNLDYKKYSGKYDDTYISFHFEHAIKDLSIFWKATKEQLKVLSDESLLWDGHVGQHSFYSTTSKSNADVIQYAFATNGIRCGIHKINSKKLNHSSIYSVYITNNEFVGVEHIKVKELSVGVKFEYCFTVPSGYFIARRKNKIFVTGNCGMSVIELPITVEEITPYLKEIVGEIREMIPVGFNKHERPQGEMWMPKSIAEDTWVIKDQYVNATKQVGTLGGGNHFIELQADKENKVHLMIHSGSRNLGFKVAKYYNDLAKKMNELWYTSVPKEHDLAFLPIGTKEAGHYITEMKYCVEFAKCNRDLMTARIVDFLREVFKEEEFFLSNSINIAHNYATMENHYGKNVWVHRKGATSAKEGELGIIPGSQGTQSYIVRGKGNKESFMSCSHGAGRKMGRKQAKRELNLEEEQAKLEGILHSVCGVDDLDEATGAYKDINVVMANQTDLVSIVKELRPLAVVKG